MDEVFLLFGETEDEDEPDIRVFATQESAERYASQHYTQWDIERYDVLS